MAGPNTASNAGTHGAQLPGWALLTIGVGLALIAADTETGWPLVAAILTAAIFYQLGHIAA